jgi:hypothetical protein
MEEGGKLGNKMDLWRKRQMGYLENYEKFIGMELGMGMGMGLIWECDAIPFFSCNIKIRD